MAILKACPFCGSDAHIGKAVYSRGSNKSGTIPEGAELVEKHQMVLGGYVYYWEKYGYSVWCINTDCLASQNDKIYKTEEDAIKHWNVRV